MKKILALLLAVVLVFTLAACGGNADDETAKTTSADQLKAALQLGNTLDATSFLSRYLAAHYQNTASVTPEQIIPLVKAMCFIEGLGADETLAAEDLYTYAKNVFVMDDAMIAALEDSEYYNEKDKTYTLFGEAYSNDNHNTYVHSYESLGDDEYIVYIRYGIIDLDRGGNVYKDVTTWKAKVRLQEEAEWYTAMMFYHSFEPIEEIPETAFCSKEWF